MALVRVARRLIGSLSLRKREQTSLRPPTFKTSLSARLPIFSLTEKGTSSTGKICDSLSPNTSQRNQILSELSVDTRFRVNCSLRLSNNMMSYFFLLRKFVETRERKEGEDRTRVDLADCINDTCQEIKIKTADLNVNYEDANCEERLKL